MRITLSRLMELNKRVGKYLIVRMPELKTQNSEPKTSADWFKANNYIAAHHNAFDQGFIEEVFSRFLRTL